MGPGWAIYSYLAGRTGSSSGLIADSGRSGQTEQDPIAQRAAEHRKTETGIVERGGSQFAEVAVPFDELYILLAPAPLG